MKKLIIIFSFLFVLNLWTPSQVSAQCPMCKISAETNMKNGGTAGAGLNRGIIYMLAAPYLLFGIIGYVYWKNHKLKEAEEKN